jgi:hypothetical protein
MKPSSSRGLHAKTTASRPKTPYFARRKLTPAFRKLLRDGKLRGGTDSTQIISDDRQDRV